MLRRPEGAPEVVTPTTGGAETLDGAGDIRCPHCEWRPHASSRWCCSQCPIPEGFLDGCGMLWNTFETSGVCPGCRHQWRWTSCLVCGGWSLHDDWYVLQDKD